MAKIMVKSSTKQKRRKKMSGSVKQLWSMCILPLVYIVIFSYVPFYGIQIAFKDYRYAKGIWGSEWCGLDNFEVFIKSGELGRLAWNTVWQNAFQISTSMIASIALAILLYNLKSNKKVKIFQTILMTPNFLSWVIVAYMVFAFLSPTNGTLNKLIEAFGGTAIDWYSVPEPWPMILMIANVWKDFGAGCILYYATLVAIDPGLFEALELDGGGRWHRVRHIMLPTLVPILCIKTIFAVGGLFSADFGLFYQLPRNVGALYPTTDVLQTYIFRMMRVNGEMGVSSAMGLLMGIVGVMLTLTTNAIVRKVDPEHSLF